MLTLSTKNFLQTLIKNIACLVNVREENKLLRGKELSVLPCVENAYLIIEDGKIAEFGKMHDAGSMKYEVRNKNKSTIDHTQFTTIDAANAYVLPCWCDSHTHLVFAASREEEFTDKIKGLSYADIAAKGGGILNSANKLNAMSEDELFLLAQKRLHEVMQLGTGAIEIKSGYGLSVDSELKMLRIIQRLKQVSSIPIKATFLGAHAYPLQYKNNHEAYIKMIVDEMLPNIAKENLADYIDVFCEQGFFSVDETKRICEAGAKYNLKPKLHVNQLSSIGGIEAAIELNALSVDHLETLNDTEILKLSNSKTLAALLPTAAYFLRMNYPPAKKLIENNCAVALASDYNPGSSPSGNMNTVISMACIQMRMLPEEAINAATINGVYAMELENEAGSISINKKANLIFTKPIPSLAYLPYSFGNNLIDKVMINGEFI